MIAGVEPVQRVDRRRGRRRGGRPVSAKRLARPVKARVDPDAGSGDAPRRSAAPPHPRRGRRARAAPRRSSRARPRRSAAMSAAREHAALLERRRRSRTECASDRAFRLADRDRAEPHRRRLARRRCRARSAAMISASTATAISAGDAAPMSRPIGARMRASAGVGDARRAQPLDAPAHGSSGCRARRRRSSRRASAASERRVVDLRIVGERGERRVGDRARSARAPRRAIRRSARRVGKALRRREGGARIDDRHVEAGDASPSAPAPG